MGDKSEAFVAYFCPWRTAGLFLLAVGFVSVSLLMLGVFGEIETKRDLGWFGQMIFSICALLFLYFGAKWALRFFDPNPAIRIDDIGIYYYGRKAVVPWHAIRSVGDYTQVVRTQHGIPIRTKFFVFDVDPSLDHGNPRSDRWMINWNSKRSNHSDMFVATGLKKSLDDVFDAVREFAPERLRSNWK